VQQKCHTFGEIPCTLGTVFSIRTGQQQTILHTLAFATTLYKVEVKNCVCYNNFRCAAGTDF